MSIIQCSIIGCDRTDVLARTWCNKHYARWFRLGSPNDTFDKRHFGLNKTHGLRNTPEYRSWSSMINRCYNPNNTAYKNYGGRGITVCDRWNYQDGFENFIIDMDWRPSSIYSIDRINNNGNYEPSNCRWATPHQQVLNRRPNKNNKSGYIGVLPAQDNAPYWMVNISVNGKKIRINGLKTAREAALEYNRLAIFHRGDDAVINNL